MNANLVPSANPPENWLPRVRAMSVRIRGPLDVSVLHRCLNEVFRRHDVLRTVYRLDHEQPVQVVAPELHLDLDVVDLRDLPETAREAESQDLARAEARRPWDPAAGPVLRAKLIRLADHQHLLVLTVHPIALDGWSQGVLSREVAAGYQAFRAGQSPELPAIPVQYADSAIWQRDGARGPELQRQLAYWKQKLAGAEAVLGLPTDRPRPRVSSDRGARHPLLLPASLVADLQALGQQQDATLRMTLLAAYCVLLFRYTGQTDLVVGSPVAGRSSPGTEPLIGLFAHLLPLRVDLTGNPPFRDLLERVRATMLEAYDHREVPLELLVQEWTPRRDRSRAPLFLHLLDFQSLSPAESAGPDIHFFPAEIDLGTAHFELTVGLQDTPEGLAGWFEYNTDLFEPATIARLAGHWDQLLAGIAADPQQRIGALPLLAERERQQLLVEWNQTQADYPRERTVHALFEEQAARTPGAVAVLFAEQQLTYRQLNARANQLAHYLRRQGVGPETLVGICVERSVEMVVGLLGILKAGGVYVPLDPAFPENVWLCCWPTPRFPCC